MNGIVAFFSQQTAEVSSGDTVKLSNLDAFLYAIVGFCIVLAVLAVLVLIFSASGMLFKSNFSFLKKKAPQTQSDDAANDNLSVNPSDDAALIAAITAAISCCMAEDSSDDIVPDFVIRRITKK